MTRIRQILDLVQKEKKKNFLNHNKPDFVKYILFNNFF